MKRILTAEEELDALTGLMAVKRMIRKIRAYAVRNLHLTLAFIGEYNDPDHVLDAMEQVQFAPFLLRISGYIGNYGAFDRPFELLS